MTKKKVGNNSESIEGCHFVAKTEKNDRQEVRGHTST